VRSFVVVGQKATASADFLLDDLPGSSGRLDVLLRCVRAAMLVSHGVRRDAVIYLVLGGGSMAPRTVKIAGADAAFLRPDERSLGILIKKVLAVPSPHDDQFAAVRPGISLARRGLDAVLEDLGDARLYVLDERAPDLRSEVALGGGDCTFFVGDQLGFADATRAVLSKLGARPVGLGPVSVHAEDAITLVSNELDRREGAGWADP
jgi:tRNA (pseudouridine54-N1)-methyltransferase